MKIALIISAVFVIFVLIFLFSPAGLFYVLEEGKQCIIVQFGKVIKTETEAGLKLKVPFFNEVFFYSKKLQAWDGAAAQISTTEPEKQYVIVDAIARWRITDPKRFFIRVQTMQKAYELLDKYIDSSVQDIINKNQLNEILRDSNFVYDKLAEEVNISLLTDEDKVKKTDELERQRILKGRTELSNEILELARQKMKIKDSQDNSLGIELFDVVIRKIKFPDGLTLDVFLRMVSERKKEAENIIGQGRAEKQRILGQIELEVKDIISTAVRQAAEIKGLAEAEATGIYNAASARDPAFFDFWRTLESYKVVLTNVKSTLTTEADYFNYLYNIMGR